ncbi:MAG: hypothetical protein Q4G16_10170, partial [Cruoricaptor ignavus]|nr:hypothetical protein [Cruoricaptor ignavus]
MLHILFTTIIIIPTLLGIGAISEKLFGKLFSGISATCFLGIFTISVVWLLVAFFLPLGIGVEIGTLIIGLSGFLYFKKYQDLYLFFNKNIKFFL